MFEHEKYFVSGMFYREFSNIEMYSGIITKNILPGNKNDRDF